MVDGKVAAIFIGQDPQLANAELYKAQPVFIDVIANTAAAAETKIRHSLGRVPKGFSIVNRPFSTTAADYQHGEGETAWDDEFIYIKFGKASLKVTLAIF